MNNYRNRQIFIILLLIIAFYGIVLIFAGGHNFSMKNKETAIIVYGSIIFALTAIMNKIPITIGLISFILNLISGLILSYFLLFSIKFNINGGHFPIFFLIIFGIEIILSIKLMITDFKKICDN